MPKVICLSTNGHRAAELPLLTDGSVEITVSPSPSEAFELLESGQFDGIYCSQSAAGGDQPLLDIWQGFQVLDILPQGVAVLDGANRIVQANQRLASWFEQTDLTGLKFYEALGNPTVVGPEPSPLASARSKQATCGGTLLVGDRYFQLSVVPIIKQNACEQLIVTLSDMTDDVLQWQKLEALHQAGVVLADLRPDELHQMNKQERTELLKENILHYTKALLDFDIIEIRLIEPQTNLLVPLLSVGIDSDIARQPLYAETAGNGVTGFVAATGQSYRCENTADDPLYLDGLMGAKSCLTVPLKNHDQIIGTFNVESPEANAFTESDLKYLESFSRDIAVAINTLELLNAQSADAAFQSISAIRNAVAKPIDEILNDTVRTIDAIENYIGHDPEFTRGLKAVIGRAREIQKAIRTVGQEMAPAETVPAAVQADFRQPLRDRRVLVIDADDQVRLSAHQLLEKYGCIVETAHEGNEALMMVRNCDAENKYDAIIADIRLPDIGGYELLLAMKDLIKEPPLILMTGYGYDPSHAIVKAKQAGLKPNAVLYKPFRVDSLIEVVESIASGEQPPGH